MTTYINKAQLQVDTALATFIKDEVLRNEIVDYYDFIEVSENFSHTRIDA